MQATGRWHMSVRRRRSHGLTKVEVLVVVGIIALLISILIPALNRARQNDQRIHCASHLRQIGQALLLYSNDNKGAFPRVRTAEGENITPVWGTGASASDPFGSDGPSANDVTAALFLLIRTQDLYPAVFCCDSTYATEDKFDGKTAQQRSNFTDWRKNLSYSFQNPSEYRTTPNYRSIGSTNSEFAVAADMNPGTAGDGADVLKPSVSSPPKEMRLGNSRNHDREGQYVLYGDGRVAWESNPFVGVNRDNIYTTKDGKILAPAYSYDDSILLPTDD